MGGAAQGIGLVLSGKQPLTTTWVARLAPAALFDWPQAVSVNCPAKFSCSTQALRDRGLSMALSGSQGYDVFEESTQGKEKTTMAQHQAKSPSSKQRAGARKADRWSLLRAGAANRATLSPLGFLPRAAEIFPDRVAVVHGEESWTYAQFHQRALRLASGLSQHGVKRGDVVAVMLPNVPAMIEAHFGVPMLGAVLSTINTRLDAETVAYILEHSEAA